jgi:hypothetical protein
MEGAMSEVLAVVLVAVILIVELLAILVVLWRRP